MTRVGQFGIGGDGLLEKADGFFGLAALSRDRRQSIQRPRITRRDLQGTPQKLLSRGPFFGIFRIDVSQHDPAPRVARIQSQDFDQMVLRTLDVTNFHARHGKIATGLMK